MHPDIKILQQKSPAQTELFLNSILLFPKPGPLNKEQIVQVATQQKLHIYAAVRLIKNILTNIFQLKTCDLQLPTALLSYYSLCSHQPFVDLGRSQSPLCRQLFLQV